MGPSLALASRMVGVLLRCDCALFILVAHLYHGCDVPIASVLGRA